MRVRLTDDEDAAVTQAAAARGMRPSDLAREALLAYIGRPVRQHPEASAVAVEPVLARLETLAAKLEQKTQALQVALDVAYASDAERRDVREALTDIAMSIGVIAGSIEPMGTDNGGPF